MFEEGIEVATQEQDDEEELLFGSPGGGGGRRRRADSPSPGGDDDDDDEEIDSDDAGFNSDDEREFGAIMRQIKGNNRPSRLACCARWVAYLFVFVAVALVGVTYHPALTGNVPMITRAREGGPVAMQAKAGWS